MENAAQNPADTILFARYCQDLLKEKKIKEAIDVCERGVRKFPFYAEGHYILGRCYQALGQIDEAKNELERTLFFAPVHLKALNSLAFILYKKKLKNIADEYLLTVALNDPLNYELHEYLKEEGLYNMLYPPFTAEEEVSSETDEAEKTETKSAFFEEEVTEPEAETDTDTVFIDSTVLFTSPDEEEQAEEETGEGEAPAEGSALELDGSREAFEVNSIIENISEVEANKLDLSQYANIEDDFSTLLSSMEKDFQDTLNEGLDDSAEDQGDDTLNSEEELLAEEKPYGNTAILFNNPPDYTEPEGEEIEIVEPPEEEEKFPEVSVLEDEEKTQSAEQLPASDDLNYETVLKEDVNADEGDKFKNNPDELSKIIDQLENREEAPAQKVSVENIEPPAAEETETEEGDINEIMNNDSLVTPTFGEILIAQKKFGEARRVFAKLSEDEPENERYKKKLQFLDKLIAMQK